MHFFCLCLGVRHGVGFINCIIFYNYRNPYPFRIKKNGLFNVHRVIEKEVFIADAPIQCAHLLIRESIQ